VPEPLALRSAHLKAARQAYADRAQYLADPDFLQPPAGRWPCLLDDACDGRLLMSMGSPGGAAIIHFAAKTPLGIFELGPDAQRALNLPNFGSFNEPTVLQRGRFPAMTVEALLQRGRTVNEIDMKSGLQAIQRMVIGWYGSADPRREGVVMGD
jgi:gamma-glutamyltranspeptidase/glutathione hydrolase